MSELDKLIDKPVKIKLSTTSYHSRFAGKVGVLRRIIGGNIGVEFEDVKANNRTGYFWFDYTAIEVPA